MLEVRFIVKFNVNWFMRKARSSFTHLWKKKEEEEM